MSRADELLPIPPRGGHDIGDDAEGMMPLLAPPELKSQVDVEERFIPGPEGAPDVRVLIYRPKGAVGTLPVIVSLHGGAFVFAHPDTFELLAVMWSAQHRCVVVDVDYRLAPEHRFPAGV